MMVVIVTMVVDDQGRPRHGVAAVPPADLPCAGAGFFFAFPGLMGGACSLFRAYITVRIREARTVDTLHCRLQRLDYRKQLGHLIFSIISRTCSNNKILPEVVRLCSLRQLYG